jgi:hypothetical protein
MEIAKCILVSLFYLSETLENMMKSNILVCDEPPHAAA